MRLDATCTTQRRGATSGNKSGDFAANLASCSITSPMLLDTQTSQAVSTLIGLAGIPVQIFQCFTESHSHTDSSATVNQLPDIIASDTLTTGGVTYTVKWAEIWPATISRKINAHDHIFKP
jgi:hypothetical protein